eukprot:CAMPEP_0176127628 /NCGR_PEP_ID=MMETSP0120_2-20121206/64466_1 /TAXON_ID=160619 /ORGANISM="Kryptoperidinium foliaceum, Strain CCMP 1326" /LENGTH=132 /DNA_ID=CAMNT_0017462665 /DNA_START=38 /DNA_END=433 /DNA_ORIENTATION=-
MATLQSSTLKSVKDAKTKVQEMQEALIEMQEKMNALLALDSTTQNMNIVAYPKIKDLDDFSNVFAIAVYKVLIKMPFGGVGDIEEVKFHVWVLFLESLNKALQLAEAYYNAIENLADQRGVLPKPFVSAEFR